MRNYDDITVKTRRAVYVISLNVKLTIPPFFVKKVLVLQVPPGLANIYWAVNVKEFTC